MSIPDSILKQMVIKFKAARIFHTNGCITLNDRMPNVDHDRQRNQIRIFIRKHGRDYKCSARRIAIYLSTGKLPDQPIFVTCSNFHCINPEHLRLGESGERSSIRNNKRDCRAEYFNRKMATGGKTARTGARTGYYSYTYSESHIITDPEKMPEWGKDPLDEFTINVKAETID